MIESATRRALLMLLAALPQWACTRNDIATTSLSAAPRSPEDAALLRKFRGLRDGELRVDSMFGTARVFVINVDTGYVFSRGAFAPYATKFSGYGGHVDGDRLVIPKRLKMVRYPEDANLLNRDGVPVLDRPPLVDVTVPVAERIPDEAMDDLREHGGTLRLKLRFHPETLLVGWDIARHEDLRDKSGRQIYTDATYSWIGGDFREAIIFNGQVIETGWYIDPKTKQRIQTAQ